MCTKATSTVSGKNIYNMAFKADFLVNINQFMSFNCEMWAWSQLAEKPSKKVFKKNFAPKSKSFQVNLIAKINSTFWRTN